MIAYSQFEDARRKSGEKPSAPRTPAASTTAPAFAFLGPLEVRANGRTHTIGGNRQRTLLAALLVSPGRLLSAEQLYDELWGENPPPTFENSLQAHVYRLRRALQQAAGPDGSAPELLTRSSGYVLEPGGTETDAAAFRRLTGEARACTRRSPAQAHQLLDEALALWRGAPFQDVAQGPMSQGVALALEEEQLSAVEDKLWLEIQLADPVNTISELKRMRTIHPWRERLTEMLMLALYRTGRQAEAVETYNSTRHRLSSELGVEPSLRLRERLREILNQAPSLDAAVPA
ncbi:AfsR/SARP family transcriptional regulator [Streptomyces sp. G44]|uniref:AfsR/SARP family transcriptional regulator n=1 Tax=Streptomyces sp. G44 TaxID=2807632 RepID=UPI001962218F|nr:AfsR/SARP family transcriptional regulator [Streptomyces sp. G44]MBM7172014.1 AfsR/SARP family transcriptional regulator [Streptomyces sp. G44]